MPASTPPVVFVLGPPGAGKGSQCQLLAERYPHVLHLSAGDLLRAEMADTTSEFFAVIDNCIREGLIVPPEITVSLLARAIRAHTKARLVLIDGFPRAMDNYDAFLKVIGPYDRAMVHLSCSEEELVKRIMERSKSSGRTDDNEESLRKRIRVFQSETCKVFEHLDSLGKLRVVDGLGSREEVFKRLSKALDDLLPRIASYQNV